MTGPVGKPTLRDVAREAGVDVGTASRSLSTSSKRIVNARTAARVREAAVRLGYQPDEAARTLRTSRSRSVGMLIPNMANPAMPPLVQGVEQVLTEQSYTTLFADTMDQARAETARISTFLSWRISGLILITARHGDDLPLVLREQEIPVVLLSRKFSDSGASSASADENVGMEQALRHLTELGHRRIAYVGVSMYTSIGVERLAAFRAGLEQRNLPDRYITICRGFTEQDGYHGAVELLERPDRPTAFVCGNDMMALGCIKAAEAVGLRCPDDISVIGYHDIPLVERLLPPLTTIRVPYVDMGRAAAELLVEAMARHELSARSVLVHPQLIVRGTTAAPAVVAP